MVVPRRQSLAIRHHIICVVRVDKGCKFAFLFKRRTRTNEKRFPFPFSWLTMVGGAKPIIWKQLLLLRDCARCTCKLLDECMRPKKASDWCIGHVYIIFLFSLWYMVEKAIATSRACFFSFPGLAFLRPVKNYRSFLHIWWLFTRLYFVEGQ